MKALQLFKEGGTRLVFQFLLYAFAFSLPLSQAVSVRLLVVLSLFSFFVPTTYTWWRRFWWQGADLVVLIFIQLAGMIYTSDQVTGFRTLETSFSLLAVPLVFSRLQSTSLTDVTRLFSVFMVGLVVSGLICLTIAGWSFIGSSDHHVFFYESLTESLGFQPTYLAYYLISGIGFGLYVIFYEERLSRSRWHALMVLFFFLLLILTGGQTTFISLLLIFSFFVLKYILEQRTANKHLVFGMVVIMLIGLFSAHASDNLKDSMMSDYWERSVLWGPAVKANPNPLFGVGTGDYKMVMNETLRAHGLEQYADNSYNAHNQFIQTYFTNGLFGLAAVLAVIVRILYMSWRYQYPLGILTFFPFVIYGATEVFLGRYQGVVFFAFLHQLMMVTFHLLRQSHPLKTTEIS